jgi:hypothetical protein|tara:strand:- start:270 stop:503 length:234 start_codon:yes stop_codon:yes gene_type:complete
MFALTLEIQSTLLAMIVFALVSAPMTYKLVQSLLGGVLGKVADGSGCPTTLGLVVHTLVFGLVTHVLMGGGLPMHMG